MQPKYYKTSKDEKALLAHSCLNTKAKWFNADQIYTTTQKSYDATTLSRAYPQPQSKGASKYSTEIDKNIRGVLAGYSIETARNWAKLYEYTDIFNTGSIKARFTHLSEEWSEASMFESNINKLAMHPAYQQIIGLGSEAIPLILQELRKEPNHWFWALKSISGEDPVDEVNRGNIQAMTDAWLLWGKNNGYD